MLKQKICLVTHLFPVNPSDYKGIFVRDLADALSDRGHEVHVVTPLRWGAKRREAQDGISIHRYPYWGWRRAAQLGELKGTPILLLGSLVGMGIARCVQVIRKHGIGLLHAYWVVPAGLIGVAAGRLTGRPVVATAAGSDLFLAPRRRWGRMLVRLTLRHLDRLVAVSRALEDIALELGLPEGRSTLIHGPVGIDLSLFTRPRNHPPRETRPGRSLIYVGNLAPPKRVDTIIRAMQRVVGKVPDCHLTLVGDGVLRPSLEALAAELHLQRSIEFLGALPHGEMARILQSAEVFVHCSDSEGLGVAIMEAMGAGLPVVASGVGGVPDLVRDGETGFMVSPDDHETYAERLLLLLQTEELRARLGGNGSRFAREHLDKHVVIAELEGVYQSLLY